MCTLVYFLMENLLDHDHGNEDAELEEQKKELLVYEAASSYTCIPRSLLRCGDAGTEGCARRHRRRNEGGIPIVFVGC